MDDYVVNFEELPIKSDEISTENVNSSEIRPQNGFLEALCIFYSSSPFSDFAPFSFIIDGKVYPSVEHYVQLQMFESFGLFKLSIKLIEITDVVEFRRAVRQNIKSLAKSDIFSEDMFRVWREKNLENVLRKANYAKYEQNLLIREQLLRTGERILVFSSKNDALLGIGMTESAFFNWISLEKLTLEDLLNYFCDDKRRPPELGRNLLGIILMEIKANYRGEQSVLTEWKQKLKEKIMVATEPYSTKSSLVNKLAENDLNSFKEVSSSQVEHERCLNVDESLPKQDINVCVFDPTAISDKSNEASKKVYDRTVIVMHDERRILYHKIGCEPRIIGEIIPDKQHFFNEPCCSSTETCPKIDSCFAPTVEQKQPALERLKALRFEKPIINPFTSTSSSSEFIPKIKAASSCNAPKINEKNIHTQYIEKFNSCSGVKRPRLQPPSIESEDLYDLEPGEIPNPNYKPPHPFFNPCKRQTTYPEIPSLLNMPLQRNPTEPDPKVIIEESEKTTKKAWKPSGNPLKDLLHKAQETLKKLEETEGNQISTAPIVEPSPVFPPFPTSSKLPEVKRSKKEGKIGKQHKVRFTNDTAMLRHHSNRWIRGGKLSSTGKFEEEADDDGDNESSSDQETFEEQCRVMKMLEDTEDKMTKKHYETQFIYEDTHQYKEYMKWYAETHNQPMPGANDNPMQAEQRKWYQFYRNAVKFVDIPDDDSSERDTVARDQSATSENNLNEFFGLSCSETYDIMLQQWRWKQIHQWKPNLPDIKNSFTSSDGVSYGGQPVVYQKSNR